MARSAGTGIKNQGNNKVLITPLKIMEFLYYHLLGNNSYEAI